MLGQHLFKEAKARAAAAAQSASRALQRVIDARVAQVDAERQVHLCRMAEEAASEKRVVADELKRSATEAVKFALAEAKDARARALDLRKASYF